MLSEELEVELPVVVGVWVRDGVDKAVGEAVIVALTVGLVDNVGVELMLDVGDTDAVAVGALVRVVDDVIEWENEGLGDGVSVSRSRISFFKLYVFSTPAHAVRLSVRTMEIVFPA